MYNAVTADPQDNTQGFYQRIEQDLSNAGFQALLTQFRSPFFLQADFKKLPSLIFESILHRLEDQPVSTDEVHVLLSELKAFESLPHTLISLPGVYQIKAYK